MPPKPKVSISSHIDSATKDASNGMLTEWEKSQFIQTFVEKEGLNGFQTPFQVAERIGIARSSLAASLRNDIAFRECLANNLAMRKAELGVTLLNKALMFSASDDMKEVRLSLDIFKAISMMPTAAVLDSPSISVLEGPKAMAKESIEEDVEETDFSDIMESMDDDL